jgi:hypothetical protein
VRLTDKARARAAELGADAVLERERAEESRDIGELCSTGIAWRTASGRLNSS